jgi:PAS domain S-box-containing protein
MQGKTLADSLFGYNRGMENSSGEPLLLVVDDEVSITITLGELLRREGYRVNTANSGAEATDLISRNDYDLVIVDLHMGGIDGMTVLDRLRRQSPLTPGIVLTGYPTLDSAVAAMRQGVDDYLVKPSDLDDLRLAVQRGLEQRRLLVAQRENQSGLERTSEELASHLAAIVECSDDAIISKSLQGIILSWNKGAERIFGYSAEEVIGKSITIIIPQERLHEEPVILDRLRRGERIDHFETVRVAKDGSYLDVSITISPVRNKDGHIIAASKIARDISDRKRAEQEMKALLAREQYARREAEEASRFKDEFLATMSHELRTPLTSIAGWAALLQRGGLDSQAIERAIASIDRNAKAQGQLIDDLLDVSRIISGRLRLDVQPVDLQPVLLAAADTVRPAAIAKGVQLQAALDPKAGPIPGDPHRMQQIVWNLLSNAVKFTPKGGRVQLRLERVNSHVEITVSDTGIGIVPEAIPHIFERFWQSERGTTRSQGGLGLGLSIVRHLTELHGGSAHVYSAGANMGSTFTIKLPLLIVKDDQRFPREAADRYHPTTDTASPGQYPPVLSDVHVLLVEDERDSGELVATLLAAHNARVTVAANAREALEVLQREDPDVIISDIEMPERDGYWLVQQIRSRHGKRGKRIPAIALSAHARTQDRVKAISAGFQMHLAKPFDPAELVSAIARLIDLPDDGSAPLT